MKTWMVYWYCSNNPLSHMGSLVMQFIPFTTSNIIIPVLRGLANLFSLFWWYLRAINILFADEIGERCRVQAQNPHMLNGTRLRRILLYVIFLELYVIYFIFPFNSEAFRFGITRKYTYIIIRSLLMQIGVPLIIWVDGLFVNILRD